jgi:hypothetical protein
MLKMCAWHASPFPMLEHANSRQSFMSREWGRWEKGDERTSIVITEKAVQPRSIKQQAVRIKDPQSPSRNTISAHAIIRRLKSGSFQLDMGKNGCNALGFG